MQDHNSSMVRKQAGSSPPLKPLHVGKPHWLKSKIPTGSTFFAIKKLLRAHNLFTVCEEAKCPNIGECWNSRTATFMVLGETCTRACRFCHVKTGNPQGFLDPKEPENTAHAAHTLGLKYVVVTMVDRDDLMDGGSTHVAKVVRALKEKIPGITVELLAGDFSGQQSSLETILTAQPDVYAHNIETVESLTPRVRDARASYAQSLGVLKQVKKLAPYPIYTKSALMLGLGECTHEIEQALRDLRSANVDFVTIGQYLRPTKKHLSIKRFAHPDEFAELEKFAKGIGFLGVASGPLVRSSYRAREFFVRATSNE